jgi:hypothetical protein
MKFGVLGGQTLDKINSNYMRRPSRRSSPSVCVAYPFVCPGVFSSRPLLPRASRAPAQGQAEPPSSSAPTTLTTPPRFAAPRAARPRPEAPPCLHELGRAPPRPNQASPPRPPLTTTPSSTPLRRRPPFGPPPPDSSRGERLREPLIVPDPFPL